jgi:hypothetical protein
MNTKKERTKKHYSHRFYEDKYKEICYFWWWNFVKAVESLFDYANWKLNLSHKYSEIVTQNKTEIVTQKTEVKMNDKMQQFLQKNIVEEQKKPTPSQQIKISEINKLTRNWSHREDWEEYTREQLMTRAELSDFL